LGSYFSKDIGVGVADGLALTAEVGLGVTAGAALFRAMPLLQTNLLLFLMQI